MTCRPLPSAERSPGELAVAARFWRSLEELAGDDQALQASLRDEFPRYGSAWDGRTDRRRFLELMASSLALAGMAGCGSQPPEGIMPYVRTPPEQVPGEADYFATALPRSDGALGVVVTSHMGRPVKVEGNPLHPGSLGATDAAAQATILSLYDPDRAQTVRRGGEIATWDEFVTFLRQQFPEGSDGRGFRVLSGPSTSPTLLRQRAELLSRFPQARWHEHRPTGQRAATLGAEQALGRPLAPLYQFADADVVVALDADFLGQGDGCVRYAHDFMQRRDPEAPGGFNRLYVVESTYTPTGAAADHRLGLRPSGVEQFTRALAAALGVGDPAGGSGAGVDGEWLAAAVEDLQRSRARSVVVLGDHYPPDLHAVVHRINAELGNLGATVQLFEAPGGVGLGESGLGTLAELVQAAAASEVDCLLVLDSNPVYDAPADLDVAGALAKVPHSIHFGLYDDETGMRCRWQIPAAHDLESWSDARWLDGTASLVQPLIAPLYGGKTVHEVLSALMEPLPRPSFEIVRQTWQAELGDDFERGWHDALSQGIVAGTAATPQTPEPVAAGAPAGQGAARPDAAEGLEIVLVPDPSVGDGRMANNGWLQELPKPMTTLTWDNAVLMAPADATRAGLANGDVVRIAWDGREASGPVFVVPGHAIGSVTCHLGYGRTRAGRVGSGVGFNAYRLLAADGRFLGRGVELTKTGGRMELARTQKHHAIDGRNIVHSALLETYRREPESVLPAALHHELPSLYPEEQYDRFAWGMAIDLSKCQGCNACVVACQAENNVPVVGKERVLEGREMHWLRMDAYFSGAADNPEVIHQPMLCQHCEKAPCEVVCPVAATTHSDDGLNEMTYNRCIGTRYCSNNCPYKVRRFNFFDYTGDSLPVVELGRNPDVTVRSRGVMEKCTYCVQRLNRARMDAKKEQVDAGGRLAIEDGVLQTACQQACPTRAIVFGDLNDPNSQVSRMKANARNYGALSELGTQPRTTYLARLRNPHPRLAPRT